MPSWALDNSISTIFGETEVINGVADDGTGFVVGLTVTVVGTVPPKLSLIAGRTLVAAIAASLTPLGMVTTLELAAVPLETIATKGAFPEVSNLEIKMSASPIEVKLGVSMFGLKFTAPVKMPAV